MPLESSQKNKFLIDLRKYLMSRYSTKYHYTFGGRENPEDISGFCFRKDLCFRRPQSSSEVLDCVNDFSQGYRNLESTLSKEGSLTLKFGSQRYLVTSYIDEGYAGEISLSFIEMPDLIKSTRGNN